MKKYKTIINEINKKVNYLSQGILNKLKCNIKDKRLELLKVSLCEYSFAGDKYIDVLHFIENCSDVEFKEYLTMTSNLEIKTKLSEIRKLRHERRELRFRQEKNAIFIKGRNLSDEYKRFDNYKKGFEYKFRSKEWRDREDK